VKLALAPLAVAVVLVAGCGGGGSSSSSSSPSPQDWANGLCSAITTWSNSVKTAGESLKSGSLTEADLKNSTSEIKSATNQFAEDLKGLGKPNTDAGQQAKDAIDKLSTEINDDVDTLSSAVDDAAGNGTKGRRHRRLEHRHLALDDEHPDRGGRLHAPTGRRERRDRAGLPGRPGLQEAQFLGSRRSRTVPRMRETSTAITVTR
jgi:hypothetical protein